VSALFPLFLRNENLSIATPSEEDTTSIRNFHITSLYILVFFGTDFEGSVLDGDVYGLLEELVPDELNGALLADRTAPR
jgi:hypothetical protein